MGIVENPVCLRQEGFCGRGGRVRFSSIEVMRDVGFFLPFFFFQNGKTRPPVPSLGTDVVDSCWCLSLPWCTSALIDCSLFFFFSMLCKEDKKINRLKLQK